MKTKMKSAFAFIAVALMIMVAVVPMVGVFTEDSSADAVAIPGTGKITIKGNVKDTSGNIAGAMVKVTVDSNAIYGITDNSGNYSIDVYINDAKDIVVEVVVGEDEMYAKVKGVADAKNPVQSNDGRSFSTYNFKGVTVSLEKIDFVSGYVAVSGSLKYASGQAYTKETEITYATGVTADSEAGTPGGNKAKSIDGKYTILVPANSKGVVIKADAIEAKTTGFDVTTSSFTGKDLKASKLNLSEITVKDMPAGITSVVKVEPATGSVVSNISTPIVGKDGKIAFEYELGVLTPEKNEKVKITDDKGYGAPYEVAVTNALTYNCAKFIAVTIKMGDVLSLKLTPEVKLCKEDKTEVESLSVDNVINGTYYAPFGNKTISADVKQVRAFVGSETDKVYGEKFTSFTSGKTTVDIKLDDKKFSLIDGTIKCDGKAVPNVAIDLSSSSAVIIGVKENKVYTDANGKYKFYAETEKSVTIAPVGNFDVASRTFTATKTTIDFNMKTIELEGKAVTDATGTPLKDVSVFYKIGTTGAYNTTTIKTDANGKFKITVNSNVNADKVFVYLSDTKYTFNSNDKNPFALSSTEPNDWKANEQTNTFVVKDAIGTVIKNSGIVLEVGKYKVHTAGSSTVFDLIGTKSDVTYADGVYSFVAKSISPSTGEYEDAYGISIKSNGTDYTFDAITKYTDSSFALTAKEQTIKGTVKDAANGALKGILVAVYDGETRLSKDVTTLNDGSFSVISKSGKLKAVDPNGVYTFNDVVTVANSVHAIKANEKTYEGTVTDADNKAVENAKITVKVVGADGKTIGSVATATDKDGKYSIITNLAVAKKIIATDADGKRTFKDITTIDTSATTMPVIKSGQYTLSGTVKEKTSNTPVKDITVTLSTYSATVDPVLVSTAVTDKGGKYSFFVNEKAGYGVVATSSGNYIFSEEKTLFGVGFVANIETEYKISTGSVKDSVNEKVLSGIKVTAYDGTKVFGEYTTDKNGEFKYPDIEGMKFKAVDPNGAYTFEDEFEINAIQAKEKTVTVTIKADDGSIDGLPLAGVTVNFLKGEKVVKTATTDAKGEASVIIAAVDEIKAVDGNTAYGAMTFGDIDDLTIKADQKVYSGFYANGDVVSGVVVTYEMSKGDAYVEKGKAVVIDNKYYIASVADEADKIVITANAQGFYAVNTFNSLSTIGESDLKIKEKPGIVKVDEDDVLFGEFYTVYNATNAQVGDKIILRASEVAYAPLEDGNETTVVKYKFNGWYVNGVKVSDDLEYVYTVTESCLVYADYKASTYETASDDNGISPSVLVIGIAAVIVALIAVVYTVIQKKE